MKTPAVDFVVTMGAWFFLLDFVKLFRLDDRVGFRYSIPSSGPVVEGAGMFVGVAVHCTEEVSTSTIEAC